MTDAALPTDTERAGEYPEDLYQSSERASFVSDLNAVGEAEARHFAEHGYLAVEAALSADQLADALSGLTTLAEDPRGADIQFESWAEDRLHTLDGSERLDAMRKFMHFVDHEPRLHDLASDPRLLRVVRLLAGDDDVALFQDMALLKPAGGGREKPWHQDNAFFALPPGSPIVGVWIALDEATPANGCMHIIPGSHQEGPVIHFRRRDWQICDTDVQTGRVITVPLRPGGALFFHGLLHHGTPTNHTDQRRRALQFHYVPSAVAPISSEERLAIFGSEGKDVTC